ncbi:MAG: hypothetical protein JSS95_00005, partial [Acidobacteria bacterium]|nr:hypothetical protein [Acidobacteriota bacterium]
LNADGTTGSLSRVTTDGTRTYGRSPSTNGSTTTLQDEALNQTLYTFTDTSDSFYETHRQVYQGSVAASTPLLDRQTCYNNAATPCDGQAITLPITATKIISSQNGGSSSQTQDTYDGPSGLLITHKDLDYGSALLQTTTYSYVTPGRVSSVWVQDGAGHTVSQVTYGYDEQTPTATSGLPQHNAVSGPRGNLTSSHTVINPVVGGATLDTAATYYDTGVPVSSTDPNGTTQYSYESTQGFATQATPPTPSSGVSLPATASYDVASGIPLSASDANNTTTPMVQLTQYDRLLRPKQINTVDGGSTTYNYGMYSTFHTVDVLTPNGGYTSTLYDPYGRTSRVAVHNGSSDPQKDWYQVDYCYDVAGNLQFVPSRYQGAGFDTPKQCSGTGTTYTYDALGRVTNINTPDGNTTYQYAGRAVKTTDVNQVIKITQYDALGRIAAICEVSGTSYQSDSPQNCNLDIAGTGYLTTYAYDLVNHTTTITQNVQQRIFQTDSLGRTIYTKEPERGETTYSYGYNSTGLQVTRTRPKANQTNTATKTHTVTQYDSAGRVVSVSYDDGTPTKTYQYDQATAWGAGTLSLGSSKGRLTSAIANPPTNWVGGAYFIYDSMGRVTSTSQCLPSGCGNATYDKTLIYTYDTAGNMTSATDGAGASTTYQYSPASEVTSITSSVNTPTNPPALVSSITNGPFGPTGWSLGNGLNVLKSYTSTGRPYESRVCQGTASLSCATQPYGFNVYWAGSNVSWVDDNVMQAGTQYQYDDLGRISQTNIELWAQGNPLTYYRYGYDRYGNRVSQSITQDSNGSGPTTSYAINTASNQISGIQYDAAGNMMSDGLTHTYVYDAEGNVIQVDNNIHYYYNAFNQRVRAENASSSTEYVYNILGQRVSVWDGSTHSEISGQYYWGNSPVAFYQGGAIHFQHQNWMGTERSRTDHNGAVEGTYQSLSFGDGFSASGTDNDAYHFAALDRDADDTHHAQFRQYSSTQGRWLSPDPYDGSYDASDPQSFNRYSYVGNRPLSSFDPSGQLCVSAFPYGNAEEPYIDPFINSAEDCGAAYGIWYDSDSSITVTTDEPDPMDPSSGPGLGAIAVNPSNSGGSNNGGGGGSSSTPFPNKTNCSATPSLWPHGIAGVVGGEGTLGLSKLGATAQGSAGFGLFGGKPGGFFNYVATAVAGFHNPGAPYQQGGTNPTIFGAGLGAGLGGMITNAASVQQTRGTFQQFTLSLPAVSFSFAYGGGIWTVNVTVGPGFAAATTSTTTNTKVKGPC